MSELSTVKRQRVSWSAEERMDWVKMFEASGKPMSEFCRENGLAEATLSLWRKLMRVPDSAGEPSALVQIPATQIKSPAAPPAMMPDGAALKLRLPCGIELDVAVGTDAQWLAGVVRALQPNP
jgi:hypothetical protein